MIYRFGLGSSRPWSAISLFLLAASASSAQPITAAALVTLPPVAASRSVRYDVKNGYSLAFVDADVRRVADAVLGAMLKLDYSVDPKVEGSITLRTAKPVTQNSLLPLLESALTSVDAVIVVQGSTYRVVPRAIARESAPIAMAGGDGDIATGYASEVVTLHNASAKEIARLLSQFMGKDIVAGTEPARNQIVISGSGGERAAARAMIERFDVDALVGMNFKLYKLDNVDADTVVAELDRIFQPPYDIIGSRVRVVPLPRLRSVLVIAADRADIARIQPWIERLDAGSGGKAKLYSYAVQNGRARDLAGALQAVLGQSVTVAPEATQADSAPSLQIAEQSAAEAGAQPSQLIAPQTALPGAPPTTSVSSSTGNGPRIVPDETNNSILIYATGEQYEFIREALDKLDHPVPQILIEATLAEVTLTKDLSLGVDWSIFSHNSTFDLRNAATAAPVRIFPGFAYSYLGNTAQAVLNTLQSRTDVRVLSAPRLMVLNNQTATLQVGDQVPIVTQQAQSVSAAGAPIVNSIELHDTGVILKVTPRVNDSGTITMDIAQEVSDVASTTTSGINSPTIQQRRLATTVATRSGEMIALGGLIRNRTTKGRSGIPLLSQIPVIGAAFGQQKIGGERTELIILLTPTIMRSADDTKAIMDEVLDKLDQTRPLIEQARERQIGARRPPQ